MGSMRPEIKLPIDDRAFNVNIGSSVPNTVFDEIECIASQSHRGRADVIRRLLLRGMAAYQRDGQLDEPRSHAAANIMSFPVLK